MNTRTVTAIALGALVSATFAAPAASSPADTRRAGPTLVATVQRLGTLGGTASAAAAVDRGRVVGYAAISTEETHAFLYNLNAPRPRMVDLTPDAEEDERNYLAATDIDGSVVVGEYEHDDKWGSSNWFVDLADSPRRMVRLSMGAPVLDYPFAVGDTFVDDAFAQPYVQDLRTDPPRVIPTEVTDGSADVKDISGGIFVGWADFAQGRHAFAYNLEADNPKVRDLGTLGGPESAATAIAGSVVVGSSLTSSGDEHAFVYNLRSKRMRDLGTLGGETSRATAINGRVVVGTAQTLNGRTHAFAYDLDAAHPRLVRLPKAGRDSVATAIDGRFVVGTFTAPDGREHAFAHDLWTSQTVDLGRFSDAGFHEYAPQVDGRLVVGSSYTPQGEQRATVWRLRIQR